MSALLLKLDGFAGQSVGEFIRELPVVATRLGLWVETNVNGIDVLCPPDANPDVLWRNFEKARDRKATVVSPNVIPAPTHEPAKPEGEL